VDDGFWTLRCQNCNATFTIELTGTEQIAQRAKTHVCPHCKTKPDDRPDSQSGKWHRIVGFHAAKPNRSQR
jgi:hypothetical protein